MSVATLAARATYAAFIGSGFAFASWASRIPQVRDRLGLDATGLGLVLLAIAAGSVLSMPLSGPVVTRVGSRLTVTVTAVGMALSLVTVAVGYRVGLLPVLVGLFFLGVSNGSWDVAMNVQGARVERLLGRSIMPRFHAGFSVGTVVGALLGAAMVALGISVTLHLAVVAAIIGVVVPLTVRRFVPDFEPATAPDDASAEPTLAGPAPRNAWLEPRTLLVGLIVLAFAFAEGTGNDWIGVALIDGYGFSPAVATLGFAVFLAAMTTGRWFGPELLDRYGRVAVIRLLTVVSLVGLALFIFGTHPVLAFGGATLWGLGISLGFPVGMSAGADDPARSAARVSVVATIGYLAFLGGPPLIGFLGDQITVLRAFTCVATLLALALLITGNLRPVASPLSPTAAQRTPS